MRNLLPIICLTIAVLLGSAGEGWSGDLEKGVIEYWRGNYGTALWEFKLLAEQGGADAQYNMGFMYGNGNS